MKCKDCCHAEMCKWIDELEGRGCDFYGGESISHKVIEDIKADIEAARYGLINDGLDVALRIIDKHIEQKPGKWIDRQFQSKIDGEIRNGWECSECGERFFRYDLVNTDEFIPKYCPNCGAKMVEAQESEVRDE